MSDAFVQFPTEEPTTRLPRYTRAAAVVCQLTPRDLDILKHVESFRLLTSEHIIALVKGSAQNTLRRLQVLFHAGYLDRLRPQFVNGGGSAKMIYAITNKGAGVLQKEGLIQKLSKTDRNAQNREVSDLFIQHRLLVSHIRAMFLLACQGNQPTTSHATYFPACQGNANAAPSVQFLSWREGKEIMDTIEVALPHGYATVPVAADGFFTLADAQGRTHYAVEADRGRMSLKRSP
jgi:hypothetical protein